MINKKLLAENYSDFTEKNYARLLRLAKKNYSFELFGTNKISSHIILRHDVDFSVNRSLKLAQIENKLNIQSTYFFRLHSEFYNIFEKTIFEHIRKIISLNHDIGLHFEYSFYDNLTKNELINKLKSEKLLLENLFKTKVSSFSFHNPEMGNAITNDSNSLGGMRNTYGKFMKNNYKYCSDSMGYWRHERLEDLLQSQKYQKLHILIHPEWWQKIPMSPIDRFKRCVEFRAKNSSKSWKQIIKKHNRMNSVWKGNW